MKTVETIHTIELNRLQKKDLDMTLSEYLNNIDNEKRRKMAMASIKINHGLNMLLKVNNVILIGDVITNNSFSLPYLSGFRISENLIGEAEKHAILNISDAQIIALDDSEYKSITGEIKDILKDVNSLHEALMGECKNKANAKLPTIKCVQKPIRDLAIHVDDNFISKYGNTKLSELYDMAKKKYIEAYEEYENEYRKNRSLLGEVCMTSHAIHYITGICEDDCVPLASQIILNKNEMVLFDLHKYYNASEALKCPSKIVEKAEMALYDMRQLFKKIDSEKFA